VADVAVPRPVLAHELHGLGLRGVWGGWVRVPRGRGGWVKYRGVGEGGFGTVGYGGGRVRVPKGEGSAPALPAT